MTEHAPGPADAPWLVTALHDIAETAPVAEAPALDGPLVRSIDPRGRRRAPVLLVAAAIVLVLAAAAVFAVRSSDGTDQPPSSIEAGAPTGWYVPEDLPDGWTVRGVSSVGSERPCPCRSRIWTGAEGSWIGYSSDPASVGESWDEPDGVPLGGGAAGSLRSDDVVDIDLGSGISGTITAGGPGVFQVTWVEGDRARTVGSGGVDDDELMAIARDLVGQPDPTEPLIDGWEQIYALDEAGPTAAQPLVMVEVETPDANRVRYLMMASGDAATFVAGSVPEERVLEGQPLPMIELLPAIGRDRLVNPLVGEWPGSDVYVDIVSEDEAPTQAEVDELAASLRPATTQEWRAFVRRYTSSEPGLLEAATVADLEDGD